VDVAARKQSKAELEARLAETRKELSSKKSEVDAVLAEVANLRKTAQEDVPAKLSDRNKQLESEQRALEMARRQVEEKREGRELRRNEMAKGIPFYKDRLGLAFERMPDGSLSFRLTLLDPQNPARPFTFALLVTPQNAYQVLRCEPRVDYDALLGQLNRDNDLSVFVRQIRRLFKNLV
jgi:flagellar biosynthesis GTPase FlhF